ncbi:MAG: hypothetical protein WC688_07260 [Parachlamydiales bacterium]|jgi:hypothetical protein
MNDLTKTKSIISNEILKLENANSTADFFQIRCAISKSLENLSEEEKKILIQESNLFIDLMDAIFTNKSFLDSLLKVMNMEKVFRDSDEYKKLKGDDEKIKIRMRGMELIEKQLIQSALYTSCFILAVGMPYVNQRAIPYIRKRLVSSIENIKNEQKNLFTIPNICFKLQDIVFDGYYLLKLKYSDNYINFNFFIKNSGISRCLIGSFLPSIIQIGCVQSVFKNIINLMDKKNKFSIPKKIYDIHSIIKRINGSIEYFKNKYKEFNDNQGYFDNFIENFITKGEKNVSYILERMTDGFSFQEGRSATDVILEKISKAKGVRSDLLNFAKENFKAFSTKVSDSDYEWTNKVYLTSNKTLSAIETIGEAVDNGWKIKVFMFEFCNWMEEIHYILNKFNIEDDWDKIENFLKEENDKIEWKSTFFTPTEQDFSEENEKILSEKIFGKIIDNILGMMNTEGGVIIVGLIENNHLVVREEINKNLVQKNGHYFFNILSELKNKNKNIDCVKREIQDALSRITKESVDKFNNLFSFTPIEIKNNDEIATVYLIEVKKAEKVFFNCRVEGGSLWVTLTKRADARISKVDPRTALENK